MLASFEKPCDIAKRPLTCLKPSVSNKVISIPQTDFSAQFNPKELHVKLMHVKDGEENRLVGETTVDLSDIEKVIRVCVGGIGQR